MNVLVDSAIKVALILALALATTMVMRRQSAELRHWILAVALLCGAAVPVVGLFVPSWDVAIAPVAPWIGQPAPPVPARISSSENRTASARASEGDDDAAEAVGALVAPVWLGGIVVSTSILFVGFARLTWLASRARPMTDKRWLDIAAETSREYDLRCPVVLLKSAHPSLLVTWGARRPKVLVPAAAGDWTDDRIRVVLRHELAHIRRHDWIVQLIAEIVRSVYWINPLAWVACERLRTESEHACDDAVIARGADPAAYATHLVALARAAATCHRAWSAAPAMARPRSLERRISAMLNSHVNRDPVSRSARLAIGIAALGLTVALAGGVFAQAATARFSGFVADPTGAPLPETTITLTNRQTAVGHAMPTDQAGNFDFAALPPGAYALEARVVGFATLRDTITLSAGESVRRDIRLNIGTIQETITVGASPGRIVRPKNPSAVTSMVEKLRGQRLHPPIKLKDVRPEYSQALREAGIEGRVVLEGRIATDGSVTGIRVVTAAHEELANAAREAASQWRFEPTRLWGTPVETTMMMTFNFQRGDRQ